MCVGRKIDKYEKKGKLVGRWLSAAATLPNSRISTSSCSMPQPFS